MCVQKCVLSTTLCAVGIPHSLHHRQPPAPTPCRSTRTTAHLCAHCPRHADCPAEQSHAYSSIAHTPVRAELTKYLLPTSYLPATTHAMLLHPDPRWLQQVQPAAAHVTGQMGSAGLPAPWGQLWSMQSAMMPAYQPYYGLTVPRATVGLTSQAGSHIGGPTGGAVFSPGVPTAVFSHGQTAAMLQMQAWRQPSLNPPSSQTTPLSAQQPLSEQQSAEYRLLQQGPPT